MKLQFNLFKILSLSFILFSFSIYSIEVDYDLEVSSGYDVGPLEGSQAWTTFSLASNSTQISSENPKSGDQHIRLQKDELITEGIPVGISSPNLGVLPINMINNVRLDMNISNISGASYLVNGREIATNSIPWTVKFDTSGNILVWDDIGTGFEFQDTTITWPVNSYFNLFVMVNPIDGFIQFAIDDVIIYSTVAPLEGMTVDSIDLYSDNSQLENEFADIDNIRINNIDLIFINGFEGVQ